MAGMQAISTENYIRCEECEKVFDKANFPSKYALCTERRGPIIYP